VQEILHDFGCSPRFKKLWPAFTPSFGMQRFWNFTVFDAVHAEQYGARRQLGHLAESVVM
jgi:hypothetical protein